MEGSPGILHHHLDSLDFDPKGGLVLAASSLTNRYWVGSLFYFKEPENAPDVEKCSAMMQLDCGVADIKFCSPTKFVCGTDSGSVQLWEVKEDESTNQITMMCMAEPVEHDDYITSLSVNADKTKVVSSSQDLRVKIWDMEEFYCTHTFKGHSDTVHMAACHPSDPNIFVSCSQDGSMLLWDTRKNKPATVLDGQFLPSIPTCISWQPGSDQNIAIGTETGDVILQDTRKGAAVPVVTKAHERRVNRVVFSPHQSDVLATISDDCTATVLQYSGEKATMLKPIKVHSDFVRGAAWHPANHKLFTCGWDTNVKATDIQLGEPGQKQEVVQKQSEVIHNKLEQDIIKDKLAATGKLEKMDVADGASVET